VDRAPYHSGVDCCERTAFDEAFDAKKASAKLRAYRRDGPPASTRRLLAEMARGGIDGWTVLDIGGGVGAAHLGLLEAGASTAVDVDASGAYLAAALEEATRRGLADRVRHLKGDAVALGWEVDDADLVTLDRVVCCYGDMPGLVGMAAARARRRLGIVMPREAPWVRLGMALENAWARVRGDRFRVHAHTVSAVLAVAATHGLAPTFRQRGALWETMVLERPGVTPA